MAKHSRILRSSSITATLTRPAAGEDDDVVLIWSDISTSWETYGRSHIYLKMALELLGRFLDWVMTKALILGDRAGPSESRWRRRHCSSLFQIWSPASQRAGACSSGRRHRSPRRRQSL